MKKALTLTKTFTLALMLVAFTAASASFGGDDTSKCRTKCCKAQKNKEYVQAMAAMKTAMRELEAELKTARVVVVHELKRSGRAVRINLPVISFVTSEEASVSLMDDEQFRYQEMDRQMDSVQENLSKLEVADDAGKQKINFNALDKEMDQVQQDMSGMDATLKNDQAKTRKAAEEKTGIKS